MRTHKEIEELAKNGEPLPEFSDYAERYYYDAVQVGLWMYQNKKFSKEDLLKYRNEKKLVYHNLCMGFELIKKHQELAKQLAQVHLCGCEQCRKVAKILEGRSSCE